MSVVVTPFEIPLVEPLGTSRGSVESRPGFVVEVPAGPGGYGEATPLEPFTESRAACKDALDRATERYEETGWRGAFRAVAGRRPAGTVETPAARHAIALAYLDWRSKRQGEPLYEYLGGEAFSNPVPVHATLGDLDAEELAARASDAVDTGFPAVKVKVGGRTVEADVERIEAVRAAVDEVAIRVDANGAWTFEEAASFVRKTTDLDLEYVEQPLAAENLRGHADLRGLGPKIAVDESLSTHRPRTILASEAADVFVLKPMALGGPDITRATANLVRRHGFDAVLSTTIDGAIARTGAIHVAASLPKIPPSGLATADYLAADLAVDPAPVLDGSITVPDRPGLGIREVDVPDA